MLCEKMHLWLTTTRDHLASALVFVVEKLIFPFVYERSKVLTSMAISMMRLRDGISKTKMLAFGPDAVLMVQRLRVLHFLPLTKR